MTENMESKRKDYTIAWPPNGKFIVEGIEQHASEWYKDIRLKTYWYSKVEQLDTFDFTILNLNSIASNLIYTRDWFSRAISFETAPAAGPNIDDDFVFKRDEAPLKQYVEYFWHWVPFCPHLYFQVNLLSIQKFEKKFSETFTFNLRNAILQIKGGGGKPIFARFPRNHL